MEKVAELAAQGRCVDVILMDSVMPNKDGPTATRELRELGYVGIIIGVTGNALPEDVAYFKSQGVNEVLPKPMDMKELKRMLIGECLPINICTYCM